MSQDNILGHFPVGFHSAHQTHFGEYTMRSLSFSAIVCVLLRQVIAVFLISPLTLLSSAWPGRSHPRQNETYRRLG